MHEGKPKSLDLPLSAAAFTSLLCVIFGSNAVAIKITLFGLGAFTTAGLRFAIGAFGISLWAGITRRSFSIKKGQLHQILIVSILFTLQLSLLYFGFSKTNASRGTLLINLQPFFVLCLAHFFIPGDRISKKKILGLMIGFSGMVLVFVGKEGTTEDVQMGDLMILSTAFVWACNTIYSKKIIDTFDPFHLVLYPMIFSVPCFFLQGLFWDGQAIRYVNPQVLGALFYQGLLTAAFGFVAWNYMLQKYGAVSLHSFIFIMPIAGVLLGGLVLSEPISMSIVSALVLIVSGVVVVNLKTDKYAPLFPPRGV